MEKIIHYKHDLLIELLNDLMVAECKQQKFISEMLDKVKSLKLSEIIHEDQGQTGVHIGRLKAIFPLLGEEPLIDRQNWIVEEMIRMTDELIERSSDQEVIEAIIVHALRCLKNYAMVCYETANTYAGILGYQDTASHLQRSKDEENKINKKLIQWMEEKITETVEYAHPSEHMQLSHT